MQAGLIDLILVHQAQMDIAALAGSLGNIAVASGEEPDLAFLAGQLRRHRLHMFASLGAAEHDDMGRIDFVPKLFCRIGLGVAYRSLRVSFL